MKLIFSAIFLIAAMQAQVVGNLTGKVIDAMNGEAIIGVTVVVDGTQNYGMSDVDGNWFIPNIIAGDVNLIFNMAGYAQHRVKAVVKAGATEKVSISMSYKVEKEVVVQAKRMNNTDAALVSIRKKAPVAQDAISSEQIAKTPDSDAGESAKRVTGITMVGNNIYVRGLGERYTTVMLADSMIPSPDPDKRVVPLDIFPVSFLDNLIIIKTYNPDLPGEFGSGIVKINPKDFPDQKFAKLSLGSGFQFDTIGKKYLSYQGGKLDWLGYDDGTRKLPDSVGTTLLDIQTHNYNEAKVEKISESFSQVYTPKYIHKAFPAYSFDFSFGDKIITKKKATVGYIMSLMLKGDVRNSTLSNKEMARDGELAREYGYERSEIKNTLGALATFSVSPTSAQKYRLSTMYSHSSKDTAQIEIGTGAFLLLDGRTYKTYTLKYVQTDLLFNQLAGSHAFSRASGIVFNWSATHSLALRLEPDSRRSYLENRNGYPKDQYFLDDAGYVTREFMEHKENVIYLRPELQIPFKQWSGLFAKIFMGGGMEYRNRNTDERRFQWVQGTSGGTNVLDLGDNLEDIFSDEHIVGFSTELGDLSLHEEANDSYHGRLIVANSYLRLDLPLYTDKLKFSGGLNYEYSKMEVYKKNINLGTEVLLRDDILKKNNFLPGLNFTFSPVNKINVRASYSKTLARPDFREAVNLRYSLNEGGKEVYGNPLIEQCDIHSADMRFEAFPTEAETLALSVFYKRINKPIELLQLLAANPDELKYTYQNGEYADNVGAEVEINKDFSFISEKIKDMYLQANFAYIYSQITVKDRPSSVYSQKKRPMYGQSPYILNLTFGIDNEKSGIASTLLLNVVGQRISVVSILTGPADAKVADFYEQPAPELDYVFKKKFKKFGTVKFTLKNIVDAPIEVTQGHLLVKTYRKGRSASLSYSKDF